MGWTESLPLFCTATEMAHNVAKEKVDSNEQLATHPLESLCMPQDWNLPEVSGKEINSLTILLNMYMDDFIGLAQAITKEELLHFTQVVLHESIQFSHHQGQWMTQRMNQFL